MSAISGGQYLRADETDRLRLLFGGESGTFAADRLTVVDRNQFVTAGVEPESNPPLTHDVSVKSGADFLVASGEGQPTKFEYGAKLGLGFAYLVARNHDDFRFATFTDDYERLDRDQSNSGEVLGLVDRLNGIEPSDDADLAVALEAYADTIESRSLVLVVSDCLEPPESVEEGLEALSRNKLVLARVMDPAERELPVSGDALVEDMESPRTLRTHLGSRRRERYRERLEAERARLLRARHELVDTGAEFFGSFGQVWVE